MSADIVPIVFDRVLLAQRRNRAAAQFRADSGVDFLASRAETDLIERLEAIRRAFATVAIVGAQHGSLGRALRRRLGPVATVIELDHAIRALHHAAAGAVVADEEALPLKPGAFDAVLSSLALQFVNDLPGTLHQIRHALKPDGLFLGALIGGGTLTELRQVFVEAESETVGGASPRVAPFADARDIASLLQRAGFALPVVDSDRFTVSYGSAFALLADLRAMGAANVLVERRRTPMRRATLLRAMDLYQQRFARADGKVLATFEIITATAWAPHESQQKPLRPGSAAARLADALGTREQATGEMSAPVPRKR